jgi:uncharacterized protein
MPANFHNPGENTARRISMLSATARLETSNGSKYLQQLCKHFAHRVAVRFDERTGTCSLPPGPAELQADAEGLTISVTAQDRPGLESAKSIIDSHLVRFAFRENFQHMQWVDA